MKPNVGMITPWGRAEGCQQIIEGMWDITTLSHGGIYVSKERMQQMPSMVSKRRAKEVNWFEEDTEWAIPISFFEIEVHHALTERVGWVQFTAEDIRQYINVALQTLRNWYPDMFELFTGGKATPNNSLCRAQQQFEKEAEAKWSVVSVIKSEQFPGMVPYLAHLAEQQDNPGESPDGAFQHPF